MTRRARIDLSSLDKDFAEARIPVPAPLPDGTYIVEVETVELRETRGTARPMLCWTLRVLAPSVVAGRRLWRNQVLGPQNLGWLKKDLRLCGLEIAKLSELPQHLDSLAGVTLQISKHTRGDYDAIAFRRRAAAP
jgi:hypothetical protein